MPLWTQKKQDVKRVNIDDARAMFQAFEGFIVGIGHDLHLNGDISIQVQVPMISDPTECPCASLNSPKSSTLHAMKVSCELRCLVFKLFIQEKYMFLLVSSKRKLADCVHNHLPGGGLAKIRRLFRSDFNRSLLA